MVGSRARHADSRCGAALLSADSGGIRNRHACGRFAGWSTRTAAVTTTCMRSSGGSKASRTRVMARQFGRSASCGRISRASADSQYAVAEAELKGIDFDTGHSLDPELLSRAVAAGPCVRILGKDERGAALLGAGALILPTAKMARSSREPCTPCFALARIYTDCGNFDRAIAQLDAARSLANRLGDEAALVETEERVADVADRRGDRAEERRASLAGLEHAKRAGSSKWLELALVNLGDSYLKTRDFAESLKYSKEALPIMSRTNRHDDEQTTLFNEGLAYIGAGQHQGGREARGSGHRRRRAGRQRPLGCRASCCQRICVTALGARFIT